MTASMSESTPPPAQKPTRPVPSLIASPDLKESLSAHHNQYEDCAPCRLMGASVFIGLGGYTYYSGRKQLKEREIEIIKRGGRLGMGGRRVAIAGMSAALVGVGLWRLFDRDGEWGV